MLEHGRFWLGRRFSRMLRPLSGLSLSLISACSLNTSVTNYCDAHSGDKITINLLNRLIVYTSAGVSDQATDVEPCSDRIETCFLSEISFVNPFEAPIPRHRNFISAERRGNEGFVITVEGAGTRSSYYIERGETFPREFTISNLDGSEAGTFVKCWLPFGPSPFT